MPQPCPYCNASEASRVRFTPWGGVVGPRLFSLVKCTDCGKHFNGRSGTRVEKAIRLYTTVSLALLALLVALIIRTYAGDHSTHAPSHQNVAQLTAPALRAALHARYA